MRRVKLALGIVAVAMVSILAVVMAAKAAKRGH